MAVYKYLDSDLAILCGIRALHLQSTVKDQARAHLRRVLKLQTSNSVLGHNTIPTSLSNGCGFDIPGPQCNHDATPHRILNISV